MKRIDNFLVPDAQKAVREYLLERGWTWNGRQHLAGWKDKDPSPPLNCSYQLDGPVLEMWRVLHSRILGEKKFILSRAYAHARESNEPCVQSHRHGTMAAVYFPQGEWKPEWGGELVFFNKEMTDAVGVVYPKPNRLVIYPGHLLHAARAVSRLCPQPRIMLVFVAWTPYAPAQKGKN